MCVNVEWREREKTWENEIEKENPVTVVDFQEAKCCVAQEKHSRHNELCNAPSNEDKNENRLSKKNKKN